MTKMCSKCGKQPVENFHKKKVSPDGLQSICKTCQRLYALEPMADGRSRGAHACERQYPKSRDKQMAYTVERMRQHKRTLVDDRGGACERCGYDRSYVALQFHHRDPARKEFNIGSRLSMSLEALRAEAAKCDLLCANCHAEEHEVPRLVAVA